jgi:GNAT superfamily N-acetyltransferase
MSPAGLRIRLAVPADYDAICELAEYMDAPHRDALPDRFRKADGPIRRRDYTEKLMSDPGTLLAVAELEGRAIGVINSGIERMPDYPQKRPIKSVLVRGIVVIPEHRRSGVAAALMSALQEWAQGKGAQEIQLNIYEFNKPAAAFFASLGFSPLSHRLHQRLPRP